LLANVEAFHPHDQGKLSDALKLLGRVLLDRHELPEACERCEQALGIDEVLHGQDHLTVGFDLNTLGCVLLAQQKWEKAWPHFKRAYAIFFLRLGPAALYTTQTRTALDRLAEYIRDS